MSTPTKKPLNTQQQQLIAAINRGVGNLRDLQEAAGYSSVSSVKYNLTLLAERGEIVLLKASKADSTRRVYTGHEFSRAWDMAARVAGNPFADDADATH